MSISSNAKLTEQVKVVNALGPLVPSTSVSKYVSLKGYSRCCVMISGLNGSTVTGSAITLKQAQAVANTGEKALAFTTMDANLDVANSDTLTATAVTSNTFTTLVTNALGYQYFIDIKPSDLDIANSFDCVRVAAATAVNSTMDVKFILYPAKYGGASPLSAIID